MGAWRRFYRLSPRDRMLVVEAAGVILAARLGIRLIPIGRLRSLLAFSPLRARSQRCAGEINRRVAWAVGSTASVLPGRTSCLIEALAAESMLRRRGYACQFRLGVPRVPADAFAPHAWIENEGDVVVGAVSGLSDYAVFSRDERF